MDPHPDDPAYQEGIELLALIRVGGVAVPFFTKKDLAKDSSDNCMGMAIYYPYTHVLIDADLPKQQRCQTMFHELLHVISDSYGPSLRETQVLCLEMAFTQILQDSTGELNYILNGMANPGVSATIKRCLDEQAPDPNQAAIDDRGVNLN